MNVFVIFLVVSFKTLLTRYVSDFPGAENRDDWFWDDNFWRYPHMTRMECPDGYGWEGNYKDGYCEACQPGHYSASWGPTVRCVSCPPGTYQPSYQSHECNSCPEWSPLSAAESKSSHDCHKWPIGDLGSDEFGRQGNGKAKVEAKVEVMGDWTFLNDMLEQISGYEAHDMSAHVMYVFIMLLSYITVFETASNFRKKSNLNSCAIEFIKVATILMVSLYLREMIIIIYCLP